MRKRFFNILLSVFMLIVFSVTGTACSDGKETDVIETEVVKNPVTIVACSDFQNPSGNDASSRTVRSILRRIKNSGYQEIDGFLCAGDYDYEYEETAEGIQSLVDVVQKEYETLGRDRMIFTQGNHDEAFSEGLTGEGANDTPEYGVFVIHEDEYAADGGYSGAVQRIASDLEKYLQEKVDKKYKRPIFVVSHVPLHYSMRTYRESCGLYSEYIFEVLNQYAKQGQNIIYLYGHNHNSWGYDDYLGGSSVYLTKGDIIYIPQIEKNTEVPNAQELQFTYLNAGYVGYSYSENAGANKMLTMTVFHIDDETVKIERFGSTGPCNLKAKGVWSQYSSETAATYGAEDSYLEKTYESPQYMEK